jgi:hypothetical protein
LPKTTYDRRIIADIHFFEWFFSQLKKEDSHKYYNAVTQFMHIKASSAKYPKTHNVILEEDFAKLEQNQTYSKDLRGLIKPIEKPSFINEDDPISTIVRTAVFLSNDSPYNIVIFTAPEQLEKYKSNKHIQDLKYSVEVEANTDALLVLNYMFKQYQNNKC